MLFRNRSQPDTLQQVPIWRNGSLIVIRFLSSLLKIALASLITGAVLSEFDISAADLLANVGMTPEELWTHLQTAVSWAIPNIILGSLIIVPVWIVIYLFRPPRA